MKKIEILVGLFMLAGVVALFALALKVSGLTKFDTANHYIVTAQFDNIGDLKVRAPVRIAGVRVGEVRSVGLDNKTFRAKVVLQIDSIEDQLPVDTSASINTAGLLGSNYVTLTPGYEETYLKNNGKIEETHPALILENLIGQLLFKVNGQGEEKKDVEKSN